MWIDEIKSYKTFNEQEETDKKLIIEAYEMYGDKLLTRDVPYFHMTSSSMILNKNRNKVLMIFHNIYNSWSWTGGHNDGDPNFLNVAIKEAKEETGIKDLKPLKDSIASIELIQVNRHIKRGKYVAPHIHMNISYLFEADENEELKIKPDENKAVKWISLEDLDNSISESDKDMLEIYHKLLRDFK